MGRLRRVTPDEAAAVWNGIPNPSARRVAKMLAQAGRRVHPSTIARWRAEGWRPDPLHHCTIFGVMPTAPND
jgi:hypothetical protein